MGQRGEVTICPLPMYWHRLHVRLSELSQTHGLPEPPTPLILAGWAFSSDLEKQSRWNETIEWAETHGVENELSVLSEDAMYRVAVPSMSGPYDNLRFGGHDPKSKLHQAERKRLCEALRSNWSSIAREPLASHTKPLRLTGKKGRRLVVLADGAFCPPWGSWSHLSSNGRAFTAFRAAINDYLAPWKVDHVDFIFRQEGKVT